MIKTEKRHFPCFIAALYTLTAGIVFIIGFMLLRFPENAGKGVAKGLELCVNTLIPSMFPFMVLSSFLSGTGLLQRAGRFFAPVTERLFGLPGVCGPVIFFSLTGGLPIGAAMTDELYRKGAITTLQAQRMMFFCINPGPAFVITGVGVNMLNSEKLGIIIYASVVISSLIIGMLSNLVWSDGVIIKSKASEGEKPAVRQALVNSVSSGGVGMLTVCAWVILFSCLTELIYLFDFSESAKDFICAITEITNGCKRCSLSYPVPLIAGIIGFSGICAQMQIMSSVVRTGLGLKYFLSARILNAGLSVMISMLLFELFPVSITTASVGALPESTGRAMSYPICIGVMLMCFLLLLGDNYRIRKTIKNI